MMCRGSRRGGTQSRLARDLKEISHIFEPRCEKTGLRGFRPGPTQTGLYSHRICLDA